MLDCAQKIMKCTGLWLCDGMSRGIRTGALRLSGECVSELPCECCGFILSPGNCHLRGKGSKLHTASSTVKGGVKKPKD